MNYNNMPGPGDVGERDPFDTDGDDDEEDVVIDDTDYWEEDDWYEEELDKVDYQYDPTDKYKAE